MIHTVSGDILLSRAQVIAHGVAPHDPMTQGLALALREKFPSMHKDYHHWCRQVHPKPGAVWLWGGPGGVRVVNLLTQEEAPPHGGHPGRARLKYVRESLRALARLVQDEGLTSLALPRVATGVGGLEWSDVKPVLEERLAEVDLPIFVYEQFRSGQQADESV